MYFEYICERLKENLAFNNYFFALSMFRKCFQPNLKAITSCVLLLNAILAQCIQCNFQVKELLSKTGSLHVNTVVYNM